MSGSTLGRQIRPSPKPTVTSGVQTANPYATSLGLETDPPGSEQFLLLCVTGPHLAQLVQIYLPLGRNDEALFQDIREAYINFRRKTTRVSSPANTPAALQKLVAWLNRCWVATQNLATQLFAYLPLQWLVWWLGDNAFLIPKSANFVRVSHHRHSLSPNTSLPVVNALALQYCTCAEAVQNSPCRCSSLLSKKNHGHEMVCLKAVFLSLHTMGSRG